MDGELAGQHRQDGIMTQLVVVAKVLITEGDGKHPLANKLAAMNAIFPAN